MPLAQQAANKNAHALEWLVSVAEFAMGIDHVADADDAPREETLAQLHAPVFQWPLNPFWTANAIVLLPVLATAWGSWCRSNSPDAPKFKAAAVFTDTVLAVAFICGGVPLVEKLANDVHALAEAMINTDDLDDKGRK